MIDPLLEQLLQELARRIASELARLTPSRPSTGEDDSSPWLNIESAAAYLDWPKQRLYKLTAQGAIPHYKHDGRLLFHRGELDAWLGEHAQPHQGLAAPANQSYS
jgi:excisionase family DNA binding protein